MAYAGYKADLQHIHASEVYGIALFTTAARLTKTHDHKQKWLALKALEEQTLSQYYAYMLQSGQAIVNPKGWYLKGRAEGMALGLMPWRMAMRMLRDGTAPFQEKFLRLKTHASPSEQAFFAYIYAHEKAIEAFAVKELAKEPNSLQAVNNLLGSALNTARIG
jgi:hypothetical protein